MSTKTTLAVLAVALVGASVMFAAGVALGPSLGEQHASDRTPSAESPAVLERLDALTADVRELRAAVGANSPEDASASRTARVEVLPGTRSVLESPDAGDGPEFRQQVLDRLVGIERRLAALAVQRSNGEKGVASLEMPPGTSVRDFFAVLKQMDGEVVKAAHQLWSEDQVRRAYGAPDTIVDHGNYIEWIYRLDADTQFDFHFTRGLCTMAH